MVSWIRLVSLALLLGRNERLHVSCVFHGDNPHAFPGSNSSPDQSTSPYPDPRRETWQEDDSWWDGAEEIDLTLPRDGFEEIFFEDLFSNNSCFWNLRCEDFMNQMSLPNAIEGLPPPPLPPFLSGLKGIIADYDPRWASYDDVSSASVDAPMTDQNLPVDGNMLWVTSQDDQCSLCRWASGGNETLYMFPLLADDGNGFGDSSAGLLIGVGLASALIGATIMGVLLRCKKMKTMTSGIDPCSYILKKTWTKRILRSSARSEPSSAANKNSADEATTNRTGWAMRLWRRSSSQAPLNPNSSPENSYSEEPYVNADFNSSVYAELNSIHSFPSHESFGCGQIHNTYSEIPDPVRPSELNICSRICGREGTYENAGYILSEGPSDPNESSAGSASTPSSAYYSDVSSCEIHNSKKKKKKKKGNDKINNYKNCTSPVTDSSVASSVPVISSHVPYHPVHLNVGAVQSQYFPMSEALPLSLQFLPRRTDHDRREVEVPVTGLLHQGQGVVHNLRDLRSLSKQRWPCIVRNYSDLSLPNTRTVQTDGNQVPYSQNQSFIQSSSSFSNFHNDQNLNPCSTIRGSFVPVGDQRPLPPLPSRKNTGPQKRNNVRSNITDNNVQAIPSEYV